MKPFDSLFLTAPELRDSDVLVTGWRKLLLNFRIWRNGLRILDFERLIFLNECGMLRRRIIISLIMLVQRRNSHRNLTTRGFLVKRADYHFKLLGKLHNLFWPDDPIFANADELPLRNLPTSN